MTLVALAKNPVPSGAITGLIKSFDGRHLRFARWDATRGPRRGTVCVFSGRGEYIEKYFEVVADLRRRGFAVAMLDWRGQGGSERLLDNPLKGHVRRFADYEQDLTVFMREIVMPDCPPPYIGLGHSLGGHVLLRAAIAPGSWFQKMVLTAPMIALAPEQTGPLPRLTRGVLDFVGLLGMNRMFVPGVSHVPSEFGPFETNRLTSDKDRYLRARAVLEAAPHLAIGGPTIGWLRSAAKSMAVLAQPEYPVAVAVPMLLIAAGTDKVASSVAIEEFAQRLKIGTHVLIPGSRHEILMERDEVRQNFWAVFDSYLGVSRAVA